MSKRFNGVPREVLIQAILEVESEVRNASLSPAERKRRLDEIIAVERACEL